MKNFDKQTLDNFRIDFDSAMIDLQEKYGIRIKLGGINYTQTNFTSKITVDLVPEDGKSIDQANFEKYCNLFGLKKEHYGHPVLLQDNTSAVIVGISITKRKYPVIVKTKNGKRYCMTSSTILNQINNIEKL